MTEGHTERLEAALAGRYLIERKLGEGGMASVYLAEDIKHKRKVALKILKPELAAVIGAERFLSEIQTTANLQHPHILALFDSGEASGYLYYVMPYIEGETLRDKLDREKQLGVEESVRIARDVADALDYAHRQGVIHRDIKPGNILLHDGRPVVADFGIALAVSAAGGGRMTETGLSLGTPHYMSPEQASADRDLSARSDVYSLGCVLYEMIGGQPPHSGPSAQSILVHILTKEATPLTELRRTVPPHVAATVSKAIEKLPADRFETAKEFMEALGDSSFTYHAAPMPAGATAVHGATSVATAAVPAGPWLGDRRSLAAVLAGLALAALASWGWLRTAPLPEPGVPTRAEVTLAGSGQGGGWKYAISPDGRWIAMVDELDGTNSLFIRSAEDPAWRQLPGTGATSNPTFSPDGQWVAYNAANQISKVPITGGPPLPLAVGRFPHWGLNDTIVFEAEAGGLYRVGSAGGDAQLLFSSDTMRVVYPHLLPNGRAVVFGTQAGGPSRIFLFEIETGEVRPLIPAGYNPRYVKTGHILYGHESGALLGVPFDLETLEATGSPVTVLPALAVRNSGQSLFAVSETGTLIYAASPGGGATEKTLAEVTLDGVETPLPLAPGDYDTPRYSPDGRRIAYADRSTTELRVFDVVTGANPQFVSGGYPVWSPDGRYLYFAEPITGPGVADGYRRVADGSQGPEQLWSVSGGEYVNDVSAGDSIIVVRVDEGARRDIVLLRPGADSTVFEDFLVADWNEINGEISPDGRWIAYQSDESGEYRIYVHSFPVITGQRPVSPGLGADPLWSPDGDVLYYRSGSRVMAVDVRTDPDFTLLSAHRELFDRPEYTAYQNPGPQRTWDIHPDGTRFIVVKSGAEGGAADSEVYLVTNWFEELRQRMGN